MGFNDIAAVSIGVAAIIGAVFAVSKLGSTIVNGSRRASRLIDDLTGEPARPGFEGRPGVLARLSSIEHHAADVGEIRLALADVVARLVSLEQQMRPNGGSSLRDAVDRTEAAVALVAVPDTTNGETA